MTLPTLIGNYKSKEVSARLKKFYSTMQQAILYAESEHGDMKNWELDDNANTPSIERTERYYQTYFDNNYFKILSAKKKKIPVYPTSRDSIALTFADGSILYFWQGTCMDLYFDVNGDKKPNKDGRDVFKFIHCKNSRLKPYHIEGGDVSTREKALAVCQKYATECMPLIMTFDNFEFKKDYPYRL